jgi:hypothetical protein
MKRFFSNLIFLLLILLPGCELMTYDEFELPPYDGNLTWTQVTPAAQWPERLDFAAVAFDNRLWVMGGYNAGVRKGDPYYEDVWNSVNGRDWYLITGNAPWKGRRGHTLTVFNDGTGEAMYLAGGFSVDESTGYRQYNNDVWKSTDGKSWTLIKERTYPLPGSASDWMPRMNHVMVSANHGGRNYLYLIGGSTMMESGDIRYAITYFNDVWRSSDGIEWEDMHSGDYGIRAGHAAAVDPATGTIFIQGGYHGIIFGSENNQNMPRSDWHLLWRTTDGQNWVAEYPRTGFKVNYLYRAEHRMAFINQRLFTFPGCSNSSTYFNFALTENVTMWKRDEAFAWSVDSEGTDVDARYSYAIVEYDDKIWLLGGDTNKNGPANDVWTAEIK